MVLIVRLKKDGGINEIEIKPTKKTIEGFVDEDKLINYVKNKLENKGKPSSFKIHKRINVDNSILGYIAFKEGKDKNKHDISFFEDMAIIKYNNKTNNFFNNLENLTEKEYLDFVKHSDITNNIEEEEDLEGDEEDEEEELEEDEEDEEEDLEEGEEDGEEELDEGDLEMQDKENYSEFSIDSDLIEIDINKDDEDDENNEEENLDLEDDSEEEEEEESLHFDNIDNTSELNIEEYNYPAEIMEIVNQENKKIEINLKEYDISKIDLNNINHI